MASNTVIQTNVLALNSHRNLGMVGVKQTKASQKLSSGYKVNSAADDAAGLAISEKMRSQIRGLDMASKNTQDAISLIQTAEGGMQEIDNMVQRIRELVVYASNDTQDPNNGGTDPNAELSGVQAGDRQKIQDEINTLMKEIDSMANRVEFNKKKLINGSFGEAKTEIDQLKIDAGVSSHMSDASTIAAMQGDINDELDVQERTAGALSNAASDFEAASDEYIDGSNAYGDFSDEFITASDTLSNAELNLVEDAGNWSDIMDAQFKEFSDLAAETYKSMSDEGAGSTNLSNFSDAVDVVFAVIEDASDNISSHPEVASDVSDIAAIDKAISDFGDNVFKKTSTIVLWNNFDGSGKDISDQAEFESMSDAYANLVKDQDFVDAVSDAKIAVAGGGEASRIAYDNDLKAYNQAKSNFDSIDLAELSDAVLDASDVYSNATSDATIDISDTVFSDTQSDYIDSRAGKQLVKENTSDFAGGKLYFQVGANAEQGWTLNIGNITCKGLGLATGAIDEGGVVKSKDGNIDKDNQINVLKMTGEGDVSKLLDKIDAALTMVTTERSKLGAAQNRLEYTDSSLQIFSENLSAAESRIRDTDMAKEMMKLTQANILQQAATSMLAQANQAPQQVLQLLQ